MIYLIINATAPIYKIKISKKIKKSVDIHRK